MSRVLVVEDEADVAQVVALGLERQGHEVKVASDGPKAMEMVMDWVPDLIVLDVRLPTMDGFEVCRRLRTLPHTSECPILFLTAKALLEDKLTGFKAGGDDYLTKPFDFPELIWRVRALLRRSQPLEPEYLRAGPLTLNCRTFEVQVGDDAQLLTQVEFDLLSHLMRHAGEVFSSDHLLQAVWGYPPGVGSPALVRVHIRNLRRKIEPDPGKPSWLRTVRGHGYTIRPEAAPP